ncbi:response regulator [Cohnella nanjingensis]|uniref:Response regulator n=1 Tax=Cohnella nanjingensis TaxID=1387779 RepID=A0A7X0RSU7_9BACL|nr:response regulator [Cohnella nanjingensis]MBB6673062.1 response regulator [Cohnella nanjingensis]
MTSMIVVDDEVWIRERLIHTVDWKDLGIGEIHEASCGEEALEKALLFEPDLMLTDIRMPNMGGLELIQNLRDQGLHTKAIIISGYSDFEYAKKAVSLGAFDYILKPVEDDDLLQVVGKCLEQIQIEKKKEELLQKADTQVNKRLPLLKEMLYVDLINGKVQDEQQFRGTLIDFQIGNTNLNHVCVIFQIQSPDKSLDAWNTEFVQFVVRNLARDHLQPFSDNDIVLTHSGETVAIVSSIQDREAIRRHIDSVRREIDRFVHKISGCSIDVGIGESCTDIRDISRSYRNAKHSLLLSGFPAADNITAAKKPVRLEAYKHYDIEALVNLVKLGDKEAALANLERFVAANPLIDPTELKFIFIHIINAITRTAIEGKHSIEDFSRFSLQFFELLQRAQCLREIRQLLEEALLIIIAYMERTQQKKTRKVIENIVRYMEAHYNEPINLNVISKKFFMNASYLSKIFKEEMNVPFSRYLMEYRVSKAAELMRDPTIKIYEIASIVGYDDIPYFTKTFKSIKGVTPVQYREKLAADSK